MPIIILRPLGNIYNIARQNILNLLEEVEGKFPEDKPKMLAVIDRFLGLSPEKKRNFMLGRRANIYRVMDDMNDPGLYRQVDAALERITKPDGSGLDEAIAELTRRYI